ncbi:MAG: fumarylacetoacetate hydrolase family protein [Clostridia bacterium]|nr:fumarylacetoacetate hydrolase family protein [Clostridia bacterium]
MKIVRFIINGEEHWGRADEEKNIIYTDTERLSRIKVFTEVIDIFSDNGSQFTDEISFDDVELLAPVIPTKNILCIGKNYYDHIIEFDGSDSQAERVRETPIFFSKALSSIAGSGQPVLLHENASSSVDYEAELAVVIGKKGINISREDALDYVYGYTILNDVTARDLQAAHQQWFKGKSLDTHCPIGPWIVTKDEIEDGNNLKIASFINGELRQNANTSLMMHDIKALIVSLSKGMTLNPGDVIATGTPSGVGHGFNPPKYLKAGDKMEVVIEGIGSLKNEVKSSL